jgi:hypothetical protein
MARLVTVPAASPARSSATVTEERSDRVTGGTYQPDALAPGWRGLLLSAERSAAAGVGPPRRPGPGPTCQLRNRAAIHAAATQIGQGQFFDDPDGFAIGGDTAVVAMEGGLVEDVEGTVAELGAALIASIRAKDEPGALRRPLRQ